MKVITEKGGLKAKAVNDKAAIEHGISQKTELSKKSGGRLEKQQVRTVGGTDKAAKSDAPKGKPPVAAQKREHFAKGKSAKANGSSIQENHEKPQLAETTHTTHAASSINSAKPNAAEISAASSDLANKSPKTAKVGTTERTGTTGRTGTAEQPPHIPKAEASVKASGANAVKSAEIPAANPLRQSTDKPLVSANGRTGRTLQKRLEPKQKIAPSRPPKQFKLSKNRPKNKSYKVLNNGTIADKGLTKRKERVIYSKKPNTLKKIKPRAIDKSKLKVLKALKKEQKKVLRKNAELIAFAMGGAVSSKTDFSKYKKLTSAAKTAANVAAKPADIMKKSFMSQAEKSDDSGVKAANLGLQVRDYGGRAVKTAAKTGVKTVKQGSKITKRVYRKLHKPTSAELRRRLKKRTNHNLVAEAKYLAKRAVKQGAAKAGKAASQAAKSAAKNTAKATAKAAQAAAKAVTSAVSKVAGLIAQTMPYSLIVIVVILLVLVIVLMVGSFTSSAAGSVAGGGAWLLDDDEQQTPEEIYEDYKEYVKQVEEAVKALRKTLEGEVTGFCDSDDDPDKPRKIIQYIDGNGTNVTYFPAYGADNTINNNYIEEFDIDDYAEFLSVLFVLRTRELQEADGVSDAEIYDFDFEKEDFEEFIKTVDINSCRWGSTFIIKTTDETSPEYCPGQNCKTKYISGCHCGSYTDAEGHTHYFCAGHKYCPKNHTKLTVKLYTADDYYEKSFAEIYEFTDNEKARYEASRAIITALLEYWEE